MWMCDGTAPLSANICSHEQFEGPNTNSNCTQLHSLYHIMFGTQSNRGLIRARQQNSTRRTNKVIKKTLLVALYNAASLIFARLSGYLLTNYFL
jgi:hypothetical protein